MTTTSMATNTATEFESAWATRAAEAARTAGEPEWALERRRIAAAHMKSLGFPRRDDELWRRTDFRSLETALPRLDPFASVPPARNLDDLPAALLERLAGDTTASALIVQRGGTVVLTQTHPELQKQGVIVCSMDRAIRDHADKLRPELGSALAPDYDWYVAASEAVRTGGAFVWVPDGVAAEVPVRIMHWHEGAGSVTMPRTVVHVGRGSKATVIEELVSGNADGISFHGGGTEVFVGDDSKLVFGSLQEWGRHLFHYTNARARVGRNAELQWIHTMLGARQAKSHAYFDLAGEGAQAFVHGFMFGDARQHFHLHTLQRHFAPHATSDLLIKCCLKDHARSIYQGLIQVAEGAQRTDAYQANRNLLLSDTARADSIPGLEILANDVRCTHGATIGHVDPEQQIYLMARGLPRVEAQRLIVEGFFAPVLDRIPLETVRERLRSEIERKIGV
ncbi:MAG: Fe-S cluster assembly protein SufD [Candidatus Eisenbacteria bacterium]|uniref:Fe-S cluster assembly protein SufD n=1 Tax=Eiseniibacteriota bacterium TaxID=2212470 RepID=A0A849T2E6_UNCEI|nr:Fe-S cluster assembly protein SufD [Candidatus Eisenbacteria bacterium]